MRGVHGVGPIDPAGRDDADRRPALFHHADLHGAGLAAQQHVVVQEERVEGVARGMVLRDVERLEIVVVALDLGAEGDLEPEPDEDVLDRGDGLRERVQPSARRLAGRGARNRSRASRPPARRPMRPRASFERRSRGFARLVERAAEFPALGRVGRGHGRRHSRSAPLRPSSRTRSLPISSGEAAGGDFLEPLPPEARAGAAPSGGAGRLLGTQGRRLAIGSASLFALIRSRQRGFGLGDDLVEAGRIAAGDLGEELPVNCDAGLLQPFDEPAVRQPAFADGGVQTDDPERAEVALALFSVAGGIAPSRARRSPSPCAASCGARRNILPRP